MSMMGGSGTNPMDALVAMRGSMGMQGPIGPNQGMGGPQMGAPAANNPQEPPGPSGASQTNGQLQDLLAAFQHAGGMKGGDQGKLSHHLQQLQQMYPKLLLAEHDNGHAQMTGPAQEQFLAAAYARMHGAKVAHVRNDGKGQRLHLRWE
jgi:hypothetical protein